jgi:hypothetical protein
VKDTLTLECSYRATDSDYRLLSLSRSIGVATPCHDVEVTALLSYHRLIQKSLLVCCTDATK